MEALQISERVTEELTYIVSVSPDNLAKLADALDGKSSILTRRDMLKLFREFLGPSKLNSRVVSNLAALNMLRDDPDKTSESILESLIAGCEVSGNDELAKKLLEQKKELVRLLNSEALYLSIKASQLFTLDSYHMHELKIVCDARPLFNPSREDFSAAIIYSTLHIVASDASENERRFSVALRARELDEIIKECERAKQKLQILQEDFSTLQGKTIVQYGDKDE